MAWKNMMASAVALTVSVSAANATVVSDTSLADWLTHVSGTTETTLFTGFNPTAGGLAWANGQAENTIPLAVGAPVSFGATISSSTTSGAVFSFGNAGANWIWGWRDRKSTRLNSSHRH